MNVDRHESSMSTRFTVTPDLPFFTGHFPDHPVVPGVLQLAWIFEFAADMIPAHSRYTVHSLKFTRAMLPGQICYLEVAREEERDLSFRYYNDKDQSLYSSGKIKFEP